MAAVAAAAPVAAAAARAEEPALLPARADASAPLPSLAASPLEARRQRVLNPRNSSLLLAVSPSPPSR